MLGADSELARLVALHAALASGHLAGAGLLKAFLSLFTNFGLLDTTTTTYTILAATGDAVTLCTTSGYGATATR